MLAHRDCDNDKDRMMLVGYSGDVNTKNKIPNKTKVHFSLVYTFVIHLEKFLNWTKSIQCLLYLLPKDGPPYLLPGEASCLSPQEVEFIRPHLQFGLTSTNGKQPQCSSGPTEHKPEEDWQLPLATFWGQLLCYENVARPHEGSLRCSS